MAIDVSRAALRLGAREVHVMYRRTGDDMPATHLPEEIEAALHEGVRIHTLVNPIEIVGQERVEGVRLQRQRLVEFDLSARRKPAPVEAETYTLPLDYVIPSIGQAPDLSWMPGRILETTRSGTLSVNEALGTSRAGVFAAGDVVLGPATIVQAVAQGNLAAVAVDTWIRTGRMPAPRLITARHDVALEHPMEAYAETHRAAGQRLPVDARLGNFREVELGLEESAAQQEARRCLRCDLEWLDVMGLPRPVAERGTQGQEARV